MRLLSFLFLSILIIVSGAPAAYALKITPFKTSLAADEDNATQIFRIENNSAEPAAVQISVLTWEIQPDGTELNRDAEDDFVVFPAQLVLKAHESKAVRIQWLGGKEIKAERPYRVLAEQIPMNLQEMPKSGSGMRFLLRFLAGLYVAPSQGVNSDIIVRGVTVLESALHVELFNQGTGHSLMKAPILHLTLENGQTVSLSQENIKPLAGENMHAGIGRHFTLPLPPDLTAPVKSARLDFEKGF